MIPWTKANTDFYYVSVWMGVFIWGLLPILKSTLKKRRRNTNEKTKWSQYFPATRFFIKMLCIFHFVISWWLPSGNLMFCAFRGTANTRWITLAAINHKTFQKHQNVRKWSALKCDHCNCIFTVWCRRFFHTRAISVYRKSGQRGEIRRGDSESTKI